MIEWTALTLLLMQALLAAITVDLLRRHVFAATEAWKKAHNAALALDVWAPIIIVLPMLSAALRIDGTVAGRGWIAIGAPAACFMLAAGAAMFVQRIDQPSSTPSQHLPLHWLLCWFAAGLVLLMLAAAHYLTLWIGQCSFAAAAILLWMNTPEDAPAPAHTSSYIRAATALTLAVLCALAHALVAYHVPDEFADVSGGIMLLAAAMIVTSAATLAGSDAAIRLGGWAATYGLLIGLGLMSMSQMIPELLQALRREPTQPVHHVAFGFGAYAIEAMIIMLVSAVILLSRQLPMLLIRCLGALLFMSAAALAAWRLSRL